MMNMKIETFAIKLNGGLSLEDIIASGTGFAATYMLLGAIMKNQMDGVTRIGVAVLGALVMGYMWRFRGPSQATAATIGGFVGITVLIINKLRLGNERGIWPSLLVLKEIRLSKQGKSYDIELVF